MSPNPPQQGGGRRRLWRGEEEGGGVAEKSQSVVSGGCDDSWGLKGRQSRRDCDHVMRLELKQPRVVLHLLFGRKVSD